jgi:uncharacterized membrane protein YhiD involved in acid resistance
MTARPIRRNAQTPDRNGKIFYTSTTSLSHISKMCRDEVKAEVRKELEGEVKAEVRKELEGEVKAEVKKELEGEVRAEISKETEYLTTIRLLIKNVIKKVKKGKSLSIIASELEEDETAIKYIYEAVLASAPEYNEEAILKALKKADN